ncbi:MAG: aldo/keto reductase [Pseudomonadota bacterium]
MGTNAIRLALGTVQFGLSYGVSNQRGQVDRVSAASIVNAARRAGMDTLDTAIAYGDSESVLGEIGVSQLQVITKLPPLPEGEGDVDAWVRRLVAESLARLRLTSLHALLLHRSSDLASARGPALYASLLGLRQRGEISRFGISIYEPAELDALPSDFKMDIVQAPFNVFDRRLETSGWLNRLAAAGVEVHVRSVFLQGLLLMQRAALPPYFEPWRRLWNDWHAWLTGYPGSALQVCLGFVLARAQVARVIVGVESSQQLHDIIDATQTVIMEPPAAFSTADAGLVNPSLWKLA